MRSLVHARFSGVKSKLSGWTGCSRRTFMSAAPLPHSSPRRKSGSSLRQMKLDSGFRRNDDEENRHASSVHLAEDDIDRAENCGYVGQQVSAAHLIHCL